jgi:hypothetical protein
MHRHTDRNASHSVVLTAAGAMVALAMLGCQSTQIAGAELPASNRGAVALGAGDPVGDRLRSTHIVLTGRDAWDRDEVIATEAVRVAEAVRLRNSGESDDETPTQLASEPVPID